MMDTLLALVVSMTLTDAAADAYVEMLINTDHPIPAVFPLGTGRAVERFWKKHDLWGLPVDRDNWTNDRIASEIRWCRDAIDRYADLPPLDDLKYMPYAWQAEAGIALCNARITELEAMRTYAVVTDHIDDELRRVNRLRSFWSDVHVARWPTNSILCRREAIKHAREAVGDEAWFGGMPVPVCP